jgi:hypothetical protein
MFCKHLLVYINSKVPFHENMSPLPSHRSGIPGGLYSLQITSRKASRLQSFYTINVVNVAV